MPERREGRAFEPPPWERAQFEELARAKEAQQEVDDLDQALQDLGHLAPVQTSGSAPGPLQQVAPDEEQSRETLTAREGNGEVPLDDARVIEMLARLSAEEPRPIDELWRIGLIGAVVTGAVGIMMIVFGVVGLAKTIKAGPMGVFSASILLMFGAGFCALAAWTAVRTLKQRGVL
ncbi:MAG: hypothetical protein CVT60_03200 [Actinobacteria bacterium HGW-Actinobacteria-10]|jgi:hypothetical protein|nr:MAG: hypothetical protein CVT60_03200 [Actinobacteria bacterium HGW-Actinobacteria-10]